MPVNRPSLHTLLAALCGGPLLTPTLPAQTTLPDFAVYSQAVANQTSVGTIDMPVSGLRFEPRVDVQSRNVAEAQADVAIRGGIFESTGFRLGAAAVGDPQTGHYFAELPVPPAMLLAPRVLSGTANAAGGFNATAGTISYGWRAIADRGELSASVGDFGYNRQAAYFAVARPVRQHALAADVEWARSEGEGSRPFGEHAFDRIAGRLQWRGMESQTDLFAGYQRKFFAWPNLYTPFGFNESENLQTALLLLNHRWADAAGNEFSAAAFWRRNKDDYEFNRAVPGASNPFLHTTWLRGAAVSGRRILGRGAVNYAVDFARDRLDSTALTFGRYMDRSMAKVSLVPEVAWDRGGATLTARAGASYDRSNRDGSEWSPLAGLTWRRGRTVVYAEFSEATQLPTYTALNSAATSGLFRGNPNLGRTRTRNLEVGARADWQGWEIEGAAFQRDDDDLVDWTFRRGVVARTANAVDVRTHGVEFVAARRVERYEIVLGYTWFAKHSDYGNALIDASFYALNFPRHRLTAALTWRIGAGFELRSDNEYRVQQPNPLRSAGGDTALLSSLGLYYSPGALKGWEFSVLADNVWQSDFQEVPAVPSARRQVAFGVVRRW
ncbi:MAG: TonB-dependent receptor [Opitutus sp.]|nr:TonB-dependent receptor [Opitutus sp.]